MIPFVLTSCGKETPTFYDQVKTTDTTTLWSVERINNFSDDAQIGAFEYANSKTAVQRLTKYDDLTATNQDIIIAYGSGKDSTTVTGVTVGAVAYTINRDKKELTWGANTLKYVYEKPSTIAISEVLKSAEVTIGNEVRSYEFEYGGSQLTSLKLKINDNLKGKNVVREDSYQFSDHINANAPITIGGEATGSFFTMKDSYLKAAYVLLFCIDPAIFNNIPLAEKKDSKEYIYENKNESYILTGTSPKTQKVTSSILEYKNPKKTFPLYLKQILSDRDGTNPSTPVMMNLVSQKYQFVP